LRLVVAFSGPSNSGKTSLIVRIAKRFKEHYKKRVAIVKHDPKDKARFDVEGKDSYKFFECGAEVVVTSPTRTTYFSQRTRELDEIVSMVHDFDLLLIEGHKDFPLPRIGVFHKMIESDYLPFVDAVAIKQDTQGKDLLDNFSGKTVLDLDDTEMIIDWIIKNAKKL
jgi:molybdopterin-guanine dinucleotide biosynthesis adapter protein